MANSAFHAVELSPQGKTEELLGTLFQIRKTAIATGHCTQYVISKSAAGNTVTEVIGFTSSEALEEWAQGTLVAKIAELGVKDLLANVVFNDVAPVVEP